MKINSWVFTNNTWSYDLGFYWSWSEAQKGGKDKGQIKSLVGGLPVTKRVVGVQVIVTNSE